MLNNTNKSGSSSENMVAGYLAAMGHEVFPAGNGANRADLVYIKNGAVIKVQVKTANWITAAASPHKYEQCVLKRTSSAPYTADEVDEFWVVGTHLWCFPFDAVGDLVNVSLGTTNPSPRKTVRSYDPNDFIVVHGSLEMPYRDRLFRDSPSPFKSLTNTEYDPETLRARRYKPGGDKYKEPVKC